MQLHKLISKLSQDVVVLTEIRADALTNLSKIWPGLQCFQVLAQRGTTAPTRRGVAIVLRARLKGSLISRTERTTWNKNDVIQTIKVRLERNVIVIGTYASTQTSGAALTEALERAYVQSGENIMVIGDLNARNVISGRVSNGRGKAVVNFAKKWIYKIKSAKIPSFFAKGKKVGASMISCYTGKRHK